MSAFLEFPWRLLLRCTVCSMLFCAFMCSFSLSSQACLFEISNTGPGDCPNSSVVCSRSEVLDLAIALLLRWTRASTCSECPQQGHLASSGSSAPVFAPVHLHDVLIAPPKEWNLLCCVPVFWHCISVALHLCKHFNVHVLLL